MVRVSIADIVVTLEGSPHRIVVLHDEKGRRALPIWIGPFEADSMLIVLHEIAIARPLTYDFIVNILEALDAQLEEVCIQVLKEDHVLCRRKDPQWEKGTRDRCETERCAGTGIADGLAHLRG